MNANHRISRLAGSVAAALSMAGLMLATPALATPTLATPRLAAQAAPAVNQQQENYIPPESAAEINQPVAGELYQKALTEQQKKWLAGGKLEKKPVGGMWGLKASPMPVAFNMAI